MGDEQPTVAGVEPRGVRVRREEDVGTAPIVEGLLNVTIGDPVPVVSAPECRRCRRLSFFLPLPLPLTAFQSHTGA